MTRTRKYVELTNGNAELLDSFLYENNIDFDEYETSATTVQFEMVLDEYEDDAVNSFINELFEM